MTRNPAPSSIRACPPSVDQNEAQFELYQLSQDLDFPDFRSKKDNFSKIPDKDIRAIYAGSHTSSFPWKSYFSTYLSPLNTHAGE